MTGPAAGARTVVRNDEEQYAIWPAERPPPAGWHPVGVTGTEEECVAYVDRVWTDMRPRSLREASSPVDDAGDRDG